MMGWHFFKPGNIVHLFQPQSGRWPTLKPKALAKRLPHFNATNHNIGGSNMLCAFDLPVATCSDMLGVVGSNLTMVKFFMQHLWMLHDVLIVWQGWCNNVALRHVYLFNFQCLTCRNRMAKCMQHVAPTNVSICCL